MRALFVAPYLPTPGSGGRTRLMNFMQRLAGRHELALVAFAARDQENVPAEYPGVVLPPPATRPRPGGIRGSLVFYRERLEPLPAFVSAMSEPAMRQAIRETVETFRPDVVQVETTEMAQYLDSVPPGPVRALDLQDVASRWFGRVSRHGSTRRQRILLGLELLKTRRYETRWARVPELVYVTSGIERHFLRGLASVDALEVANGVDTEAFRPMPSVREEADLLLFVGPLTYDANLDGMTWFARRVLPIVRRERPSLRVDVVGTPVDVAFPPQVNLLGRVEDVRPHLARAPVSIVPVRVGSGTRYKILEALAMQRAVVSTTVGAEGLGVRDGEHVLIADAPEEFARAVLTLLDAPELRARLGSAGRAHIASRYDWGPLVARIEESWRRVATGAGRG